MSYNKVLKVLGKLNKTKANYDVIIYVGEKPSFKEFRADSKTLCNKSDYFKKILSSKDIEKKDEKYVIKEPNITPQAFDVIFKYVHTGSFKMTDKTGNEILNIIVASEDLKLNHLVKLAEDFLIEDKQQFLQDDPVGVLKMVYEYKTLNNIQEFCIKKICNDPEILFNSLNFINLPAPILEIILKQDDLNLTEIEIWENLIKWGLAQEKILSEDIKLNQEKFNVLERTLNKFIPFIRFYDISSGNYFNKVRPYEKVLSKELREEILKFYMIPGHKPTINNLLPRSRYPDSILITQKHVAIFTNWINRKKRSANYKFNLLYRASKNGNTAKAFHDNCNNKGATIVVAKFISSEQIVGGYNPFDWNGNGYRTTRDSFIFSFTNRTDFKTAKVYYSEGNSYSIYCDPNCGPMFGKGDLQNRNGTWKSAPSAMLPDYPALPNLPKSFDTEDYEVFQVITV